ncbi:hypothetical protein [Demequina gelatinilytica]|uniref:hypothetical protein n=1 Tax=Demequina gelatinilytica TaxID=1638980 RepID=UPI0012E08D26|nr:hypothetical protein [Demequina gelatinilytica]
MSVAESGVSRRRIVQGAAWATPAVLIATASPPAAASQTPGAVSLATSTFVASGVNSVLTLVVTNSGVAGSEPLTGTQVTVTVPASQVTAAPVSSSGSGWVLTGPTTSGTSVIYTATYAASIATSTSSTAFALTLAPAGEDPYPLNAALAASATSNGATVTGSRTVTRAGSVNAFSATVADPVAGTGSSYSYQVTSSASVTNAKIVVTWTPEGLQGQSSTVDISGWTKASAVNDSPSTGMRTTTFTYTGTLAPGAIVLSFKKPKVGSTFTLVATGTEVTSTTVFTRTVGGQFH